MSDIFYTVLPDAAITQRILSFIANSNNFFIGIGKPTKWDETWGKGINEINPPIPNKNIKELPEPIIYKRVELISPVIISNVCNQISLDSSLGKTLLEENISSTGYNLVEPERICELVDKNDPKKRICKIGSPVYITPTYLYISATINSNDYSAEGYRSIGFFTDLDFQPLVDQSKLTFLPSEVIPSIPHWVSYNTLIKRLVEKTHKKEFLMKL